MTTIEILKNNLVGTVLKYEANAKGIITHITYKLFKRGITNTQRESNDPYFYKYISIEKPMGVHRIYETSKIVDVFLPHTWAEEYYIKLENDVIFICSFDTAFEQIGDNSLYLLHNAILKG